MHPRLGDVATDARPEPNSSPATEARFLMCPPLHYAVSYSINPWMNPESWKSGGSALHEEAEQQWFALHDTLLALGAAIEFVDPAPNLPDLVFTANAAIVLDGKALCLAAALAAGAADQGGAVVQWRFRDRSVRIAVRLGIQWGQRVTIELDGRPEQAKGNALLVEFGPGRVDFSGVTELVVPSPGMYHLKGSYKSDVASVRGLQWRIVGAGGTNPIGESRPVTGSDPTWREFRRIPNRFHKTSSRQHGSLLISPLRL